MFLMIVLWWEEIGENREKIKDRERLDGDSIELKIKICRGFKF